MSYTVIPGLSFVSIDEVEGQNIEVRSFLGRVFEVPRAHTYGNCRSRNEFEKLGTIFEGKFGAMYKCRDKRNGKVYALKKYIFSPKQMKDGVPVYFLRELSILKLLKHENVVHYHSAVSGKSLQSNFLLLDFCVANLCEIIEKEGKAIYSRDVVKYIMKQLFDGLSYIHQSQIIHRNICCQNLLFTEDGILKISGFGSAIFQDQDNMAPYARAENAYKAPEILLKANYGQPADIWSAGCILAHLLLKRQLFTGSSEMAVLESIFSILGTPSEAIWPGFDDILKKGTDEEKIVTDFQPYSEIKNLLVGVPERSSQLLQDLIIYYPLARVTAQDVMKSDYIVDIPRECSEEKMTKILTRALCASKLLDVPMQIDG